MKKGQESFTMVYFIVKVFVILGIATALGFLIQYFFSMSIDTTSLRSELFLQRLLNNPNGVIYVDDLGTGWPGTIAWEKFTSAQLEASMQPAEGNWDWVAAELELSSRGQRKTIYYNKEKYVSWQRMVAQSDAVSSVREFPVQVQYAGTEQSGMLKIHMITPRG
ncbi:MAG TPA: hypothetical protein VJK52_03275 [Candidatus Nanoarchaeia archaeon]|nr:hypothetical protein [Candidatus Nanoarchaeia archaeon]